MVGDDLSSLEMRNRFPGVIRKTVVVPSDAVESFTRCRVFMSLKGVDFMRYDGSVTNSPESSLSLKSPCSSMVVLSVYFSASSRY